MIRDNTFTDTHCHIHEENFADSEAAYQRGLEVGIGRMIMVGTDVKSSHEAVEFAASHTRSWAAIGIHPHEAAREGKHIEALRHVLSTPRASSAKSTPIVPPRALGSPSYSPPSPRHVPIRVFEEQLQLALDHHLPISFHVREAFDDFWPIFDNFKGLRGVLHSYTDNMSNMEKALTRDLWIGVNGISTFARDKQELYRAIPYEKILLETDAPYLTPHPHRGKVNEPALLEHVANHIANLQSINLQELSRATEASATTLFHLK